MRRATEPMAPRPPRQAGRPYPAAGGRLRERRASAGVRRGGGALRGQPGGAVLLRLPVEPTGLGPAQLHRSRQRPRQNTGDVLARYGIGAGFGGVLGELGHIGSDRLADPGTDYGAEVRSLNKRYSAPSKPSAPRRRK